MKKFLRFLIASAAGPMSLLAQPVITTQPANQIIYGGSNVVFSVVVSGIGPFTYQWQCNGTNLPNDLITTVAGNGNPGYNGDGGLADMSSISGPEAVAVDASGNVFIAEYNSRVRKVDTNGYISTVAGNGTNGFAGDGGAATNANLAIPSGLAFDSGGNLYIADYGNNNVRRLDTNGVITTVVGNGLGTYAGDGGAATNASLLNPFGLAFDSLGSLYVADQGNNVIRKVDPSGIITTVPAYGLVSPMGVALDSSRNLYIANCNGNTVIKVDTNGAVTTFAGGNSVVSTDGILAVNSGVNYPRGVAVDTAGNVYIAAFYDNRVRVVDTNGIINTVAGNGDTGFAGDNGDALNANFHYLVALTLDQQNNIYTADFFNYRIRAATHSGPTLKFSNVTTNLSGTYALVVSDTSGSITSSVAMLNVVLPPNIVTQPMPQQILVSSNVTFSVSAYGTAPINYQWQFNGTNLSGATNNTFIIGVVTTNHAGNYSVLITNSYGSVASSNAALTVLVIPPGIASQPGSQTVPSGSNALLTVVASGSPPFNYQWFSDSTPLDGQTNASLSLSNVTTNQTGAYSVSVTSPYGSTNSHVAILMVAWLPSITMQPTDQSVRAGDRVLLTAGVSGVGPLTFQWQLNGTNLPDNLITTIAGNGTNGYSGDGGMATNAKIGAVFAIAADGAGNVFIADAANRAPNSINYRIRKVDADGVITTIAGNGVLSFSGDGGAATNARVAEADGVALDGAGNLYIADTGNNRIRKVDTNGTISTVAGTGTRSFSGDGGPATNATLFYPSGITIDSLGNLFIADSGNGRVRKIDTNGIITTLAGKSSVGSFSGDGGAATNANLYWPQDVAVDGAGNLFIADEYNNRIREVDAYGVIKTMAGNGLSNPSSDGGPATNTSVYYPYGVAVDGYGDVFIADTDHNRIRMVDPYGILSTVAGTNTYRYNGDGIIATDAELYNPSGVRVDPYGRILVADTSNSRIRRFGQGPTLVLGSANATDAGNYTLVVNSSFGSVTSSVVTLAVASPPSIVTQPQSVIVTNGNSAGFSVAATGTGLLGYQWYFNDNAVDGADGGTNAGLNFPNAAASQAGNYTCVVTNDYGSATSGIATLIVLTPPGIVTQPTNQIAVSGSSVTLNLAVSGSGPFTYQWRLNGTNLPNRNNLITRVAGNVQALTAGDGGLATDAFLGSALGVAIDPTGNLFISESAHIRMVDTNYVSTTNGLIGIIHTVAGNGAASGGDGGQATNAGLSSAGVAVDGLGNFYIADPINNRIRKVNTNGIITTVAGTNGAGFSGDGGLAVNARLNSPDAMTVDGAGNLFIADRSNSRIRKVSTNSIITTVAGGGTNIAAFFGDGGLAVNAKLSFPAGVAVDGYGNLFIADWNNNRIRKVDVYGIITTLAGNGTGAFSGDGGAATNANVFQPDGVALDADGDVFISDNSNNRIRMIDVAGNITTVAGTGGTGYSGDGGLATNANIQRPAGLGLDSYGNLYIAGNGSGTIRKVDLGRTPMLQLYNLAATNTGNYDVIITSPYGSVTSSIVSLTVLSPPSITTQPISVAAPIGGPASFNVAVSGTAPFDYQWFTSSGRSAVAVPVINAFHQVNLVIVEDGGAGYVTAPQVRAVGGGGSGATATAVLNNDFVMSIVVNSPGSGYTTPPTIQIDPPSSMINGALPGGTSATLTWPMVTGAYATNYFVVVTNSYGSVTSSIVALRPFLTPQNFTAQYLGTGLQLQFTGTPNFPYSLQSATNLVPPIIWQSIATSVADTNGNWQFLDINLNGGEKYYRALGQ